METFNNNELISIFNQCFEKSLNTVLIDEGSEPIYIPALCEFKGEQFNQNRIYFAHGYFSSALHEISHWMVAGCERRLQEDYGYWYAPDGRNLDQQIEFEKVEVKPQAIEWILHQCCKKKFRLSLDNLSLPDHDSNGFAIKVHKQVLGNLNSGLNPRMLKFCQALMSHYQNMDALSPSLYLLGDL